MELELRSATTLSEKHNLIGGGCTCANYRGQVTLPAQLVIDPLSVRNALLRGCRPSSALSGDCGALFTHRRAEYVVGHPFIARSQAVSLCPKPGSSLVCAAHNHGMGAAPQEAPITSTPCGAPYQQRVCHVHYVLRFVQCGPCSTYVRTEAFTTRDLFCYPVVRPQSNRSP